MKVQISGESFHLPFSSCCTQSVVAYHDFWGERSGHEIELKCMSTQNESL
jgi:hypothetical protein